MGFDPKQFAGELLDNGVSETNTSFLVGYKAAIDCIEDIKNKGVQPKYGLIVKELEITLLKLQNELKYK